MAIELISTIKQKNDGTFPIAEANDLLGGYYQVDTLEERNSIPAERILPGMACYVNNDPINVHYYLYFNDEWCPPNFPSRDKVFRDIAERDAYPDRWLYDGFTCYVMENTTHYFFKNPTLRWTEMTANAQVYIGPEPPVDTGMIWVCPEMEDFDRAASHNSQLLKDIQLVMSQLQSKVDDLYYIFDRKLDAGFFDGDNPDPFKDDPNSPFGPVYGNVEHMCIKRGKRMNIRQLWDGEFGYAKDTKELLIGNDGRIDKIGGGGGVINPGEGEEGDDDMPSWLTETTLDLKSPDGKKWRITPNNYGELMIYDAQADEAEDAVPENAGAYAGLIINHVYGGGAANSDSTPISHGFIELYNNTENAMNLKGLTIQVGTLGTVWQVFPLKGIIQPHSSYLIRCKEHSDPSLLTTRYYVERYDASWDVALTDLGLKVLLVINKNSVGVANPFDIDGNGTKTPGYIDMLSAGGADSTRTVDGYEGTGYKHIINSYTTMRREDFGDKNASLTDVWPVDFKTTDVAVYRPRSSWDGKWDFFFNKPKLDANKPNLVFMCFGKTTRDMTFTWQSWISDKGGIRYKLKTDSVWTYVESEKRIVQHITQNAMVHSVILKDLKAGLYDYQAGTEGRWSDEYSFEIKSNNKWNESFKFLHITDQQGWNEREYNDWKTTVDKIREWGDLNVDFMLNTGDISQNGNREFEWIFYHDACPEIHHKPHMATAGNNDLINKKDITAFTYYFTFEDSPFPSTHSYDVGPVHFICLDSNAVDPNEETGSTDTINPAKTQWLIDDLAKANEREDLKFIIVYMHIHPYSIVPNTKQIDAYVEAMQNGGVDLSLCGHNHDYCRTKALLHPGPTLDDESGITYVMAQAGGFKLSGKVRPLVPTPEWYAKQETCTDPVYINWTVTSETITMEAVRVSGLKKKLVDPTTEITKQVFDTLTINTKR